MTDPTGTAGLRRAFLAEGNRRLARVRSLTHSILVEHDLMQTRKDPFAQFLPHPGNRLAAFADWFEHTVNEQLLGMNWWGRFLQRGYDSGLAAGGELVRESSSASPSRQLPAVYSELSRPELAGIAAALVQQVTRQAGLAGITRQKPQLIYRQVLTAIKKVGQTRIKAFVNYITVQLHNAARLEQFRAAGVEKVGIIPERLVNPRPSRFLKHDHAIIHDKASGDFVNVLTAGDERVCIICQDISEEGPYTLDEAQGLIPAHPNCRCAFVPAFDMRFAINRELATAE